MCDKNNVKLRKESNTYLTTVCRHCWNRQIMMEVDKLLELSVSIVAFISWRRRLTKVLAVAAKGETGSKGGGGRVRRLDVDTRELAEF